MASAARHRAQSFPAADAAPTADDAALRQRCARREARRLARSRRLLECVGVADERRLAPRTPEERYADGKTADESGWNRDTGITRDRRGGGTAAKLVISEDQIG